MYGARYHSQGVVLLVLLLVLLLLVRLLLHHIDNRLLLLSCPRNHVHTGKDCAWWLATIYECILSLSYPGWSFLSVCRGR